MHLFYSPGKWMRGTSFISEWVADAKRDETREQRLKTSIEWTTEEKVRNWKYQPRKS